MHACLDLSPSLPRSTKIPCGYISSGCNSPFLVLDQFHVNNFAISCRWFSLQALFLHNECMGEGSTLCFFLITRKNSDWTFVWIPTNKDAFHLHDLKFNIDFDLVSWCRLNSRPFSFPPGVPAPWQFNLISRLSPYNFLSKCSIVLS